jgi:hypothetical protein
MTDALPRKMVVEEPVAGSFSHFAYKYWGGFAGFASGWNYWVHQKGDKTGNRVTKNDTRAGGLNDGRAPQKQAGADS